MGFDDDFDRMERRVFGGILAVWIIAALASLALTGVAIWAIVELVQWVTTK